MVKCKSCGIEEKNLSSFLSYCKNCIISKEKILPEILKIHKSSRIIFNLKPEVPNSKDSKTCKLCAHSCKIGQEDYGFCSFRTISQVGKTPEFGKLSFYYDPLPTNCVASWLCDPYIGKGYNLAIFFHTCSFNCLYCQNWHWKYYTFKGERYGIKDILKTLKEDTKCICFFGGDPGTQGDFALKLSKEALKLIPNLRICFETNGYLSLKTLKKFAEISLKTGGIIKIDLKAHNENLNIALTGFSNKIVLENIKILNRILKRKAGPPPLVISTLMVPNYVDWEEIGKIASFISSIDKEIPYSLLCFFPCHFMEDLGYLKREEVERAIREVENRGIKYFKIGNSHLII